MDDNELVEEARNGRPGAFETLVKRYEKKVFHLAYGFVQDTAAADDLAQEVFVKA
jgi:RNA polymerase sigma-70 factor (ECF subfamily)